MPQKLGAAAGVVLVTFPFVALATTGNCLPFFLIGWGQQHIDSGLAGILMAVMPLATLLWVEGSGWKAFRLIPKN